MSMEEMMMIKKEVKKMLNKEFGKEFNGCFYMNKKQMEKRQATIRYGYTYNHPEMTYEENGETIDNAEMERRIEDTYNRLAEALKKYGYKFEKDIKTSKYYSFDSATHTDYFIRLFF